MGKNEFFFVNGDQELVLGTPNGERFKLRADDAGVLSMTNEKTGEAVSVGGGALVVTITGDGVEYSCDKSPEEIYEAVVAGVPVSGVLVEDGTVYAMTLLQTSAGVAYFRYVRYDGSGDATGKVFYLDSNEVSVYCEFCHVHTNRDPV